VFSESAYEDEEQFARGGATPGEIVGEENDGPTGRSRNNFPLKMTVDTRGRIAGVAGGFLRGAGQHVNFDPEAPPLPPPHVAQQQTISLLERPEIDRKVKVGTNKRCKRRKRRL